MFTGIVTALGTVEIVKDTPTGRRLTISGGSTMPSRLGDSVAVNGVCLTSVELDGDRFVVEVVAESLERSNLGEVATGDVVDLELPVSPESLLDGHIVQGHVDGVGTISSISNEGDARRVVIDVPDSLVRYIVEKGSITIDGVSLTVTNVGDSSCEVVLIPHTLQVTVLGRRHVGDRVNLEVDVLAKYVERLLEARQ